MPKRKPRTAEANRVAEIHWKLIPPTIRALIEEHMEMKLDLGRSPVEDVARSKVDQWLKREAPYGLILTILLEKGDPADLIAIHMALEMTRRNLEKGGLANKTLDPDDAGLILQAIQACKAATRDEP